MRLNPLTRIHLTWKLMRPHQWIKNIFVFSAPLFAKELDHAETFTTTLIVFFCFCLISSAVYVVNDIADLQRDRAHPLKRRRPLAAGQLGVGYAIVLLTGLTVVSLAVCAFAVSPAVAGILALYAAMNVAYSFALKYVVIVDVMMIAAGFILRIVAGAIAADTIASYWLLLCTLNVALFLGFTKRRAEIMNLGDDAQDHREVLAQYSEGFLDQMISVVTSATLVCYILYTVDERTADMFGHRGLVITVPFVMYGIFRYLYLTYHHRAGDSPTRTILMDPLFLINNVCWAIVCVLIIYRGDSLSSWLP